MALESVLEINEELKEKEEAALTVFRELAPECDEDMAPKFVRYSYDMRKATFYFECEHRCDFRDLVKKLSSRLSIFVEMRQISPREQASLVGGLGPCGQELCCCKVGNKCCHKNSTIKMAKNQNLSLNPTKISGMCGRLMCCLRFENEYYKDFKERSPKVNSLVKTPDGDAKVVAVDALHEIISLKIEDEKARKVALSDFKEGSSIENGFSVEQDVWEEAGDALNDLSGSAVNVKIDTSLFTGDDHMVKSSGAKLSKRSSTSKQAQSSNRRRRNRGNSGVTARKPGGNSSGTRRRRKPEEVKISRPKKDDRKPRRRRTTKIKTDE